MNRRRNLSAAIAAFLCTSLVAGCTTNPYTGEREAGKSAYGAAAGALAGALIGAATGGNAKQHRKNALIGAGAGAIAGAGVGYYMDVQEAKLRKQLEGTGVSVTRNGENIVLNMPGNVTFKSGSPDLNPDFFRVLDSVGLVLKEYDKTLVSIAGHTDSTGSDELNQRLSLQRATSVGQYLSGRGVSSERMVINGYGKSRPVSSNDTGDGRQQNRRVELTLEPLTKES
ncbi:MAG TPA: OmpA family protein [Candidatus Binatia bacterium]|nr:OmpA family protein [Candidatus Binatia bacterium]